ncbi:histone deacetylase [Fulvivirga kasyanovii]|uniref:Histone deacetylase n=1 Tax=Fulvivirga kasyanovii TaxID=396812 RepID=A0ABW9RQ75_9BACT|nr:histone deacetylase [Fulvivirga kasyanovii]MTI25458.1 histone deacetylase [Fulvivirga kasyanovii]
MLKIAWSDIYSHPLPENHRFPMLKYELLPEQLLYEGTIGNKNIFSPQKPDESLILRTHDPLYWDKLKYLSLSRSEIRKTGFPLSRQLVEREITILNGTVQCALYALQYGIAMNIAGGTHHAFSDRGEGFCLLNDIAVASNYLLDNELARQVLVVDLDVHQGNGTAEIFQNDSRVFTFSMHGANNYPLHKECSDLDIALPDGTTDAFYLNTLEVNLKNLLDQVQPDFLFFQSGVDVLGTDKLGRLNLSIAGCRDRDKVVLQCAKERNIPLVASMGGGYSEDIKIIVEAHANTYRLAQEIYF